jgi:hypothetical protein
MVERCGKSMIKRSTGRVERGGLEGRVGSERSPEIREIAGDERARAQGGGSEMPFMRVGIICSHIMKTTHDSFKGTISNLSHLRQVML